MDSGISSSEFRLDALKNLEPMVNPVRQYCNRKQQQKQQQKKWRIKNNDGDEQEEQEEPNGKMTTVAATAVASGGGGGGDAKLADVLLGKFTSASVSVTADKVDRTKLIRTYNVKLRLKKPCLYKCFDCDVCFTNADFLELHEKSHGGDTSGGISEIDLQQEEGGQSQFDTSESELIVVKQNAWFAGDFEESGGEDQQNGTEEDEEGTTTIQLDCTVEEREDNFDITFDRTKCRKTYTTVVKYKVKKDPVGKCELCERLFYTVETLQLHRLEHERFLDFGAIEPQINIDDSPSIEESTLVLDESFYRAETEDSDIMETSDNALDLGRQESVVVRQAGGLRNGEWKPAARRGSPPYRIPAREEVASIEGRFQCEICSRRFRFRPAYNVHLRTHSNSRPFRCGECSRRFVSRAKLFLHSYGHSRNRRAALRCDRCGATFGRPRQLLEHLQQGHEMTA